MSVLNFDKVGRPLAIVDGGALKGKTVYVATEEERGDIKGGRKFKEIDLPVGSKFKLVPTLKKKEKSCIYVVQVGRVNPPSPPTTSQNTERSTQTVPSTSSRHYPRTTCWIKSKM